MTQPNAVFSIDSDGWCEQARKVPSPHHNERASVDDISLLVVHGISLPPGEFGGPWIDDLFLGRLDPTAHPYFAGIHQLRVSARVSSWDGREACNDFSIGIELEGTDEQPYSDAQYEVLSGLSRTISRHYPAITAQRIVGHCDIAPGRKTDPGDSFEWQRYRQMLNFK